MIGGFAIEPLCGPGMREGTRHFARMFQDLQSGGSSLFATYPVQCFLRASEVSGKRQRSPIFLGGSGFVALLFQNRAKQVMRLKCRRLFHRALCEITAQ